MKYIIFIKSFFFLGLLSRAELVAVNPSNDHKVKLSLLYEHKIQERITTTPHKQPRITPAAAGRAIIIHTLHPKWMEKKFKHYSRLKVFRVDAPSFLGDIDFNSEISAYCANLHSIYIYSKNTVSISQYSLNKLQLTNKVKIPIPVENASFPVFNTGISSSKTPLYLKTKRHFIALNPLTLHKLPIKIRTHNNDQTNYSSIIPANIISPKEVSNDGTILYQASKVGLLSHHIINCHRVSNHYDSLTTSWLSSSGTYNSSYGELQHIHTKNNKTTYQDKSALKHKPSLYGNFSWGISNDKTEIDIFSHFGKMLLFRILLSDRYGLEYVSFKYNTLVLYDKKSSSLKFYRLEIAEISKNLDIPPWIQIEGKLIVKGGRNLNAQLLGHGLPTEKIKVIKGPNRAIISKNLLQWKAPYVRSITNFNITLGWPNKDAAYLEFPIIVVP